MKFETTRFGQVEVKNEEIIVFPDGPLGFPDCTRFTLIDEERAQPFRMLQSLDNPSLAFVVINPQVVRQNYKFQVTKEDLKYVKATSVDSLEVYAIVTMARDVKDITVNLQGPLVINYEHRLGHQFVLVDSDYTTREPLVAEAEESAKGNSGTKDAVIRKKAV